MVLVTALIFLIEIISETMKMLSLSLRLYGNIHGGHEVVSKLNDLGQVGGWNVPIGGLLIPIKLLTCVVQALVFTLLLAVYLGLVTHHEEEPGGQHSASDETGRLLEGNPHALEAHAV
jgi:F-type H+-transporting ATPase subunit a